VNSLLSKIKGIGSEIYVINMKVAALIFILVACTYASPRKYSYGK
jgi:hypothetical protein